MTQSLEVEAKLRKMILEMDIGPGERLTERWAESQLEASRTPIRAALIRLESEGLVRRVGKGWIVAPLDIREMEQLLEYREALEIAALRLTARRLDIPAVEALEFQMDKYTHQQSKENIHELGTIFHIRLAELSGNQFISQALSEVLMKLSRIRWLDTEIEHVGWDEHLHILKSLKSGQTELAIQLLSNHLETSRSRLMKLMTTSHRSLRARGISIL